ncbi:MFS transporter [Streptomyces sp. NPDC096057]|uniref:MFS transporter n=1 Tax=Streptomyces sp. NPDC096057 TaxID=3155543 RepID=UPI00332A4DA9
MSRPDALPAHTTAPATSRGPARAPLPPRSRRAVRAAFLGFFVDYFDIYLPVVALAPAIGYFQPADLSPQLATTLYYVSFAATLLGRPLGALVFGHIADTLGRQRATLIALWGIGVCTLAIAALPGYASVGFASVGLLIGCRFVGGIFMGGEYTSANPLAIESSPQHKRGLVGGMIQSAYPAGYISVSLITLAVLELVPSGTLNSPYVQWGWRIPFAVGALLVFAFIVYFRRVEESPEWAADARTVERRPESRGSSPVRDLFTGPNRRRFGALAVMMTGWWFTVQAAISVVPGLLTQQLGIPADTVTTGLLLGNLALAASYLTSGVLGQRLGRRRSLITLALATAVLSPVIFYFMIRQTLNGGPAWSTLVLATLLLVVANCSFGILPSYLIEQFPPTVRASGYGLAYSVGIIVPSFYSFYMLGLAHLMPYSYTPIVFLVLGGAMAALGAALAPDDAVPAPRTKGSLS